MNTQTQEALKMAIEQMNVYAHIHLCEHQCQDEELLDVIQACKEALAQPAQEPVLPFQRWSKEKEMIESWQQSAQEPVAWMSKKRGDVSKAKMYFNEGEEILPLYTHPAPSWQGLSDDEIQSITWKVWGADALEPELDYAHAIEANLKEKNT